MDFGEAIKALKEGKKVARVGWNGKGMFVYYVPPGNYPARTDVAKTIGESVQYNAYFAIKNVNCTVSTWVPSINDCLAEDWEVVDFEEPGQSNPTGAYGDSIHGELDSNSQKTTPNVV